ncbi:MAG: DMT family transporter [Firmicutes bacterium]|nr:DMT family transporter [Bacillota bacterium]
MTKVTRMYLLADVSLLAVAAIWGLTFVTVKNAIAILPPFAFNFYRFGLATLVMLIFALPTVKKLNKETVRAGIILGIMLFTGYSLQTLGLLYTTASNAGFITGLSVVLVPIFSIVSSQEKPELPVLIGAVSATIGLGLIAGGNFGNFNIGDILVLCCAVSFALHILYVGKYSALYSTIWLVTLQIGTVALLSGLCTFFFERGTNSFVPSVWLELIITALFATCFAFFVQNYMQRFTSPSHTAIILTTEPVFSVLFSVLLLQETLTAGAAWGGLLIVVGMLCSEIKVSPRNKLGKAPLSTQGEQE